MPKGAWQRKPIHASPSNLRCASSGKHGDTPTLSMLNTVTLIVPPSPSLATNALRAYASKKCCELQPPDFLIFCPSPQSPKNQPTFLRSCPDCAVSPLSLSIRFQSTESMHAGVTFNRSLHHWAGKKQKHAFSEMSWVLVKSSYLESGFGAWLTLPPSCVSSDGLACSLSLSFPHLHNGIVLIPPPKCTCGNLP